MMRHLVFLLALLIAGCLPRGADDPTKVARTEAAKVVTITIDGTLDELGALYQSQGEALVAKAQSREEVQELLGELDAKWAPIWAKWAELGAAHRAWKEALKQNQLVDAAAYLALVGKTWCELVVLVVERGGALHSGSQVPFTCSEVPAPGAATEPQNGRQQRIESTKSESTSSTSTRRECAGMPSSTSGGPAVKRSPSTARRAGSQAATSSSCRRTRPGATATAGSRSTPRAWFTGRSRSRTATTGAGPTSDLDLSSGRNRRGTGRAALSLRESEQR